jgi:hypothetical protein
MKAAARSSKALGLWVGLALVGCAFLAGGASTASAVQFEGSQTNPGEWTYTLTYNSLDNYSISQPSTTITLTGLTGVVNATGPTSTDFPGGPGSFIDLLNLEWTPQVLGGGTIVQWTHDGPGTGNFGGDIHVFGFTVLAPGAVNGPVTVTTDGFSTDIPEVLERDIEASTSGPTASAIPEPASTVVVGLLGVGVLTLLRLRRRG